MTPAPSIPRRCLCGILIAILVALLFFPLFQRILLIPGDKDLIGIRTRSLKFPEWTLRSWWAGQFAAEADAWIREQAGMRGWLVMLNRQIRYSLFGQVEPAPLRRRAVVIGKAPFLHEKIYLIAALRNPVVPPGDMESFAARLAGIHRMLKEQGTAFLVILAPNKPLLYPDTLPRWARPHVSDERAEFPAFLEALRRHDVPCLDTMSLFRQLRPEYPDLVATHGSHWSYRGAWVAWQHAIPVINRQHILPEIPVPATEEVILKPAIGMDGELHGQLNLFWGRHLARIPAAYPVAAPPPPESEQKLDALVVGDSYGFGLMDALARSRLCHRIHYLYYMRNAYETVPGFFDSRKESRLVHFKNLGLFHTTEGAQKYLAGKDLVIVVLTSFNINKYSWGFDRMVNRLYGDPDASPIAAEDLPEFTED